MQPEPLQRCPMCDYSLVGLPDRHRCPECGLEYDRSMEVIVPRRRWFFWGLVGTVVFWWLYMVVAMVQIIGGWKGWLAIFLLTLLGAWLLKREWVRRRRRVVVWGGGILVIGRRRQPEFFEWSRIGSLSCEFVNGISLFSPDGEKLTLISTSFLGSAGNLDAFVMALKRWKGRGHDEETAAGAGERGIPLSAQGDNESPPTGNTGGDG